MDRKGLAPDCESDVDLFVTTHRPCLAEARDTFKFGSFDLGVKALGYGCGYLGQSEPKKMMSRVYCCVFRELLPSVKHSCELSFIPG